LLDIPARDPEYAFLANHYRCSQPAIIALPPWRAFDWTLESLQQKIGEAEIQYQIGRSTNPDYEIQSHMLRTTGTFNTFVKQMQAGPANDVYIIAQNHGHNQMAFAPLYEDIAPLPGFLTPYSSAGFFWIGGTTMTPLHHDKTNNLLCQIIGDKLVRVVAPDQFDKLEYRGGVHSNIGWLTEEHAQANDIEYTDFWLPPRHALFLPVGWWHCVKTFAMSVTVVYTNFIWPNNFTQDAPQ
jgi:hypothetical protein